jgi:tyrosine-protein kinase Etk/Wzc
MDKHTQQSLSVSEPHDQEGEVNLMDLLLVLAKYNRLIIGLTLLGAVLAVTYVLLATKIYTARTVLLPPQQESQGASALLSSLGGGGLSQLASGANLMLGVLASRTLADEVIQKYNLQSYYEQESLTRTRMALWGASSIKADKGGFIAIEFSDKNPRLAAAIANAFVEELAKINQKVALTNAARRRLFFENQVKMTRENLAAAEVELKRLQEKTGIIALDRQSAIALQAVASMRAEIASKEVELSAMRGYATEKNPNYQRLQEVITGLRTQLAKLEQTNTERGDSKVSTGKLPETGLKYARAMRDLKEQEAKFEYLGKLLEGARIDESKDAPLIQVVDKAIPPEYPSKPKGLLILIIFTVLGFILGVVMAFIKSASERASEDTKSLERKQLFYQYLRKGR